VSIARKEKIKCICKRLDHGPPQWRDPATLSDQCPSVVRNVQTQQNFSIATLRMQDTISFFSINRWVPLRKIVSINIFEANNAFSITLMQVAHLSGTQRTRPIVKND
tara:strand:- start:20 stop:340 length:321 start_codon:yes stop_codon:yes gene_type:complete